MTSSFSFQPTTAPGREGSAPAPQQPVEGQAPPAHPGGQETQPAPFGGGGGGAFTFLILALPLLLIFMMTRSQNKKQKQLESSLKNGDRVVTQAGLIGKITDISERSNRVRLEIAPGVTVQVLKSSIQGVDPGESAGDGKQGETKPGEKSKEPAKAQEKKA